MMLTTTKTFALAAMTALLVAACDDPAKGKTKAQTGEAVPQTQSALAGATTLLFDSESSKVEWTGSKVSGKHDGGFKTFRGEVKLVDGAAEKSSVTVDIDTNSLFTDGEKLAGHLKSPDFFDVAKFPKASFASTDVKKGSDKGGTHTVTGNLTLHGVTKSIVFPANIRTSPSSVDVDAEFAINRKDFGLVYAGKPDDLIRDDVVIKLTIRSTKKPS